MTSYALLFLAAVPFTWCAVASTQAPMPAGAQVYERVIHLPKDQFVQKIFQQGEEVFAQLRGPEGDRDARLDSGAFMTIEAAASPYDGAPATRLPREPMEEELAENLPPPCGFDWLSAINDPADGRMHISSSLDGCCVLLLSSDEDIDRHGSVFVYQSGGRFKSRSFDGLIQATLSPDGKAVLVQADGGLHFYTTEQFLTEGKSHLIAVTGEEQWKISHVGGNTNPGLFLLKKKLSVELYSTVVIDAGPLPEDALRLASFVVETSTYAVNSEFDIESRILVVAERKRVRVARIDEDYKPTFLIDYKIDPKSDVEIRSCLLDRASAALGSEGEVRLAVGLRRKVTVPTRTTDGSCEVRFCMIRAEGEGHSSATSSWITEDTAPAAALEPEILFESEWDAVERFAADSPQMFFSEGGDKLFSSTRDQVWRYEVPR